MVEEGRFEVDKKGKIGDEVEDFWTALSNRLFSFMCISYFLPLVVVR